MEETDSKHSGTPNNPAFDSPSPNHFDDAHSQESTPEVEVESHAQYIARMQKNSGSSRVLRSMTIGKEEKEGKQEEKETTSSNQK